MVLQGHMFCSLFDAFRLPDVFENGERLRQDVQGVRGGILCCAESPRVSSLSAIHRTCTDENREHQRTQCCGFEELWLFCAEVLRWPDIRPEAKSWWLKTLQNHSVFWIDDMCISKLYVLSTRSRTPSVQVKRRSARTRRESRSAISWDGYDLFSSLFKREIPVIEIHCSIESTSTHDQYLRVHVLSMKKCSTNGHRKSIHTRA